MHYWSIGGGGLVFQSAGKGSVRDAELGLIGSRALLTSTSVA